MISLGRSCSRHRPVLLDFIDHGGVGRDTAPALAHLDRCRRCTEMVEDAMLTITALRRLNEDASTREPRPDAWPRLRRRIEASRRRGPAVASPLAGVAMSFAIVSVLALPLRLTTWTVGAESTAASAPAGISPEERRAERAYIAASRRATPSGTPPSTGSVRVNLSPEILQVRWKEEHSAKSSVRPPDPI